MKKLFIILSLIISFSGAAQANLDSLWGIWNNLNQPDTNRLKAMTEICRVGYIFKQPDSAFYYAQLQYDFAKAKGEKKYMAAALNLQGVSFTIRGDFTNALDYYKRSLTISKEIGNLKGVSSAVGNIAKVYIKQGDYTQALNYETQGLKLKEALGERSGISKALNGIGIIYDGQGDYANAIDYYTRSLRIKEELGDKSGAAISLNNIGLIYHNLGDYKQAINHHTRSLSIREGLDDKLGVSSSLMNIGMTYQSLGDYTKAIDYYTRSLALQEEIGDRRGRIRTLNNLGVIYYRSQGDYSNAIDYCSEGLRIGEEIGDKRGIALSLVNIGRVLRLQGHYAEARKNGERGLVLAQEINEVKTIQYASSLLYMINKELDQHESALEMYELYVATRDSMRSEENQRAVIRQEYKYAYEKQAVADSIKTVEANKVKDAELLAEKAKTKQQQQQKYFLFGGLAITLLFGGVIFNRFRVTSKQKLKNLELEKQISVEKLESASQNIREKLEIIEKLEDELQLKSVESEKHGMERISTLFKENNYLDEPQWNEIIHHYDKVYNNFSKSIMEKFDKVTKTDVKLLILVKMGFLNKEISAIRGTTTDSTKKAKQRLRAKLGVKDLNKV